jgi:hypothetical protein
MKSAEFIGWALGGLEREIAETRERLALLNAQAARLRGRVGQSVARGRAAAAQGFAKGTRRRRLSAEGRKAISDSMKKRWAEYRKRKKKSG